MSGHPRVAVTDLGQLVSRRTAHPGLNFERIPRKANLYNCLLAREHGYHLDSEGLWKEFSRTLILSRGGPETTGTACKPRTIEFMELYDNCNSRKAVGGSQIQKDVENGEDEQPAASLWVEIPLQKEGRRQSQCDFELIQDKIFIKDKVDGHFVRKVFTLCPVREIPLKLEYVLTSLKRWETLDVWDVGLPLTLSKSNCTTVLRAAMTLVVLEKQRLLLINMLTGNQMDEIWLPEVGSSLTYSNVFTDPDDGRIYIESSKSKSKHFVKEFLILSYSPLKFLYRVQIASDFMGLGYSNIEISTFGLVMVARSSSVEISSLERLLQDSMDLSSADEAQHISSCTRTPLKLTMKKKLPVLDSYKTSNGFLTFLNHIWPPHVCVQSKCKQKFLIYNSEHPATPVAEIQAIATEKFYRAVGVSVSSYSVESSNIILTGSPYGYKVFEFKKSTSSEASTTDLRLTMMEYVLPPQEAEAAEPSNYQRKLSSLRKVKRKKYTDLDQNMKANAYFYDQNLDILAIAVFSQTEKSLRVRLYDHSTMKLFKELQPIRVNAFDRLNLKDEESNDAILTITIEESQVVVKLKLIVNSSSAVFVYICNLLRERVENLDSESD